MEVVTSSTMQIAIGAVVTMVVSSSLTLLFAVKIHRKLTNKCRSDEKFKNGLSFLFQLRLLLEGLTIDNILKIMSETVRQRLYVSIKTSIFAKEEVWMVGHPAIVKEVFGPSSSKNWEKGDQAFARRVLTGSTDKKELNKAMLYTGDDEGWRHARQAMTPFFYNTDFTTLDEDMDRILLKHLDKVLENSEGTIELLNMTLNITIDLVVQLLYGIELPKDEFDTLVKSLAAYIVPGSPNKESFPGGMTAFEYHRYVGFNIGKKAKAGTLGAIIRESDLPELLKNENFAFFLEALTPAFASFWTTCHVLLDKTGSRAKTCKANPIYRQQCIKEALRMYPPVPSLWPRFAKKDIEIPNPIYDERIESKVPSTLSKLMGSTVPLECQKTIKIPKGTVAMVFPSVLHYDDRFWFEPKTFSPERWDNDPFVLERKGSSVTSKIANRASVNFGGLLSTATKSIEGQVRSDLLEGSKNFYDKQKVTDGNIRNFMFGTSHESFMADANYDRLYACSDSNVFDFQSWSFMPFGLGMHACMGRRLALRMVDAILYHFLEYNITFYNGVAPSMFTSKDFAERIVSTAAVYNMPADPCYVTVMKPKKAVVMRISYVDHAEKSTMRQMWRNSMANPTKSFRGSLAITPLIESQLLEDDEEKDDDEDDGLKEFPF